MLLSMTGFGEAHCHRDGVAVAVEVRSINSRFFKLAVRASEGYGGFEPQIEALVRKQVRRGTIQVSVRIQRTHSPEDFQINGDLLRRYRGQLEALQRQWNLQEPVPLTTLLLLPGVIDESGEVLHDASRDWPAVEQALGDALTKLSQMRADEGRAMSADLRNNVQVIADAVARVAERVPLAVEACRAKVQERLQRILAEFEVAVDPADVLKEVGLMADRADISEEIVRLRSHLEQFLATIELPECAGRKLEFVTQEMLREANTIGSKAGDLQIAKQVIEVKSALERIREMIQNVE